MSERTPAPADIRRYLLRELPEDERSRLEESYFSDDTVLDQVEEEEDQLVADYVMGRLAETERRRFEESLLGSPYYRERVETTTRLRRRIASDRGFRRLLAGPAGARPGLPPARLFPGRTGTVVAFALLTTLLVAALVAATRLKGQLEEARRRPPPVEPAVVVLALASPGAGPLPQRTVTLPASAPLLLVVPGSPAAAGEGALVSGGGSVSWRGSAHGSTAGGSVYRIPAGAVAPGRYEFRLIEGAGVRATGSVEIVAPPGS